MKRRLIQNLSVNTLQLVINQVFGLVIFYVLSIGLDKNSFGQINLALAILLAAFNILSFGIDQIAIKRVASGAKPAFVLSLYMGHVLITGLLFYGLLLFGKPWFSPFISSYHLLLLIGIGKLMIFFSTPFKQLAGGLERFNLQAYMLVISNIVRGCCLLAAALLHTLSLQTIVIIFIAGDVAELAVSIVLFSRATKIAVHINWYRQAYLELLKECLPQVGVVIITSALARFDWIFIGIFLSAAKLAEYSFAYKVFEIATLPLLAIAPLLIPRFTQLFKNNSFSVPDFRFLIRAEMLVAAFIGLILNMAWAPVIDGLTAGKYGAINSKTVFILTLCMPLIYLNNFLWTVYFSKGKLKMILTAFILTFCINVGADLILIPIYKNEGAAAGFLLATLAQSIFFIIKNDIAQLSRAFYAVLISTGCALLSGILALHFFPNAWTATPLAIVFYLGLLLLTRQIRRSDRFSLQQIINW